MNNCQPIEESKTCFNCGKHFTLFDEDGCFSFCLAKGAKLTDDFASEVHDCSQVWEDV